MQNNRSLFLNFGVSSCFKCFHAFHDLKTGKGAVTAYHIAASFRAAIVEGYMLKQCTGLWGIGRIMQMD
jgi:hypothetical protein